MQNKENGNYRPTFYCMRDEKTSLLWLVPLSSRVEKFQAIYDKQIEKYGNCLTIVIGDILLSGDSTSCCMARSSLAWSGIIFLTGFLPIPDMLCISQICVA